MRRAPSFWWREQPSAAATLLRPVGAVWGAVARHRLKRSGTLLPVPVICVGNFVAGGAGKTPAALAIADVLETRGMRPAFVTRGYGRQDSSQRMVLRVNPVRHDASETGDEPQLLALAAPTYVSADRLGAARRAIDDGATVLILDDGLQNPGLVKTIGIAMVDCAIGIGNGLCLPAGPLRAPLDAQWPLVNAVCLVGDGRGGDCIADFAAARGVPILRSRLEPDPRAVAALRNTPILAFAGIGRPAKFFDTLEAEGLDVRRTIDFPDHHRFTGAELAGLAREAATQSLRLVTTSKDRVRLPNDFAADVLPVTLVFEDQTVLSLLLDALKPGPFP